MQFPSEPHDVGFRTASLVVLPILLPQWSLEVLQPKTPPSSSEKKHFSRRGIRQRSVPLLTFCTLICNVRSLPSLSRLSPMPARDAGAAGETRGGATARLIKTCGGRSLREFPPRRSSRHYQTTLQQESGEQMLQIWSQTKTFPLL